MMRVQIPNPAPRTEGDYFFTVTPGYGDPTGEILLDEAGELRLQWLGADDCERLIRAATTIRDRIAVYRAQLAAPHGRGYVHQGTCQLCGKPEDHEDHDSGMAERLSSFPGPAVRL